MSLTIPSHARESGKGAPVKMNSIHLDRAGEHWADSTLHHMSTDEKIGQLFMVWARVEFLNVADPQYGLLLDAMEKYHVGGFAVTVHVDGPLLLRNQPYEAAMLTNHLQQASKVPLLMASDFERGLSTRLYGTAVFPHAMAFGAAHNQQLVESFGRITGEEARAVGIHWNFFPDADVNSNPANPIINTRSFGEDPQQVGDLVAAYIQGAHSAGMLVTAKHFPGHGDTDTDSHLSLARVAGDMERLNGVELAPFRRAIAAGVDAVMVAHVSVPALEPDPLRVATTSNMVVTGLLKQKMGFQGLVISDALDMAALTRLYAQDIGRASVEAFKAGNDVLLIPADLGASFRSMQAAVQTGEIPLSRLDESVLKILRVKASLGLNQNRLVDLDAMLETVNRPENIALGQQIAEEAVTLVRDNGRVLPLKSAIAAGPALPYTLAEEARNRVVAVVMTEDLRMETGRALERELRVRAPDAHVIYVDSRIVRAMTPEVLTAVGDAQVVIVAAYSAPTAGRAVTVNGKLTNSVALGKDEGALLEQILAGAAAKTVVIAVGNPYLAAGFPGVETYLCTFSDSTVSEVSAVRAVFGEIRIQGRLPVSIPGIAQRGSGLDREIQRP